MKLRILIVDDEFGLADLLQEVLTELGYEVTVAINGRQGLAALEGGGFGLVLLDLMMPVMDGPEMARAMRADPRHAGTPIVLMTAVPGAVPAEPGLVDAVLVKPFTPSELLSTIDRFLSRPD